MSAGHAPAEAEYRPGTGVAQGKRWSKPKQLSMWWMWPPEMPKCRSILGGVSVNVSATWRRGRGACHSYKYFLAGPKDKLSFSHLSSRHFSDVEVANGSCMQIDACCGAQMA